MKIHSSWRYLSWLALAACSDPPAEPPSSTAAALSCPVDRCTGTACDHFDPAGDIVDGTGIPRREAPDTKTWPDVPLIRRRVVLADAGYVAPVVPAWRSSSDGRIAIVDNVIRPVLLETLRDGGPISQAPRNLATTMFGPGVSVLDDFGDTSTGGFLCTLQRAPAPCPLTPGEDCYNFVIASRNDNVVPTELVYANLHVRVAAPKTTLAQVVAAEITDKLSIQLPFHSSGEMVPTGDGHLVTLRIHNGGDDGDPPDITYRLAPGKDLTKPVSLAYAYAQDPCNIPEWFAHDGEVLTSIRPWPAAYSDARLHDHGVPTYGIAARPIRGADGIALTDEDILSGSYPWIDREGNNLFFSTVDPHPISKTLQTRYPMQIEPNAGQTPFGFIQTAPRGVAVVGAWTQGKTVMLDGMLNNDDYGFSPDATHDVVLYQSQGAPRAVRVNGGANNGVRSLGLPFANGNNHEIESLENTFAMHRGALPVTPRDVVWTVTRGLASDELAFDDLTNPNLVLFAEMNAAWTPIKHQGVQNAVFGTLQDGFDEVDSAPFGYDPTTIQVQNAATSPIYALASAGTLIGNGRIEPLALGGVRGRGLWLEAASRLAFTVPAQPPTAGPGFYASVFVDARDHLDGTVPVMTFASATPGAAWSLALADGGGTAVLGHGSASYRIDLSCAATSWKLRWHHLGLRFEQRRVTLLIDGNPVGDVTLDDPAVLGAGQLSIGGVRGWYDEARLEVDGNGQPLSGRPAPELLCNIAHGTVVSPQGSVQQTDTCATDYTTDLGVGRGKIPANTSSRRADLLEGDAPLFWDLVRPESRGRAFCLSCHVDAASDPGRAPKLTLPALARGTQPAYLDSRTQPMQPPSYDDLPAQVLGQVPARWIDGRLPAAATVGPLPLLSWVLPHS